MLCAISPGKDSCNGDSGGPLVVAEGDGETPGQNYRLVGTSLLTIFKLQLLTRSGWWAMAIKSADTTWTGLECTPGWRKYFPGSTKSWRPIMQCSALLVRFLGRIFGYNTKRHSCLIEKNWLEIKCKKKYHFLVAQQLYIPLCFFVCLWSVVCRFAGAVGGCGQPGGTRGTPKPNQNLKSKPNQTVLNQTQ